MSALRDPKFSPTTGDVLRVNLGGQSVIVRVKSVTLHKVLYSTEDYSGSIRLKDWRVTMRNAQVLSQSETVHLGSR